MTDTPSLSPPNYVSKEAFGGKYRTPALSHPQSHSWEEQCLDLQAELREAQRRLHEARVSGDFHKIREAELEEIIARERYDIAVNRCGSEAMFGLSCAVRMGRDPGLAVGPIVEEVLRQVTIRMKQGGVV